MTEGLLWVAMGALAFPVLAELACRLLADHNSRFSVTIGRFREWDPHRAFRLKRNFSAGDIHTNSKGILGPEFEARQPAGVFRIVVLGDSYSFIPARRNYPTVLGETLRRRFPDLAIEVVNAATPGYSCTQARIWYEQELNSYDHDLLLVLLGWNDMGQYGPEGLIYKRQAAGYTGKTSVFQKLLIHSYLARVYYVWQGYQERRQPVSLEPMTEGERALYTNYRPDHFEQNMRHVIQIARARGRIVLLVNYGCLVHPEPSEDEMRRMHFPRGMGRKLDKYLTLIRSYRTALTRIAEATQTPIIDVESLFDSPERRRVFTDSMHIDERGAELIGSHIAEQVAPFIVQATSAPVERTAQSPTTA